MNEAMAWAGRAAALRDAFDGTFARPPVSGNTEAEDLLAIRVAGQPYALRLNEITGLVSQSPVVAVPAGTPALLGVTGIRGAVVPVFDLPLLLGFAPDPDPPWLVLCGAEPAIGLAFAGFEGYLRLDPEAFQTGGDATPRDPFVQTLVATADGVRAVLSVPRLITAISSKHRDSTS